MTELTTPVSTDNLLTEMIRQDFDAAFASHKNGSGTLNDLRAKAFASFDEKGIPGRKEEEYKYAKLHLLDRTAFRHAASDDVKLEKIPASFLIAGEDVYKFVFVNGRFNEKLSDTQSLPAGCAIHELSSQYNHPAVKKHLASLADHNADPFVALNTAFVHHGLLIHVDAKRNLKNHCTSYTSLIAAQATRWPTRGCWWWPSQVRRLTL